MAIGRSTLTMAISLEGADKVTTDLSKFGPAAEKAFGEIQKAAERAGLGLDKRLGLALVAIRTRLAALQAAGARLSQSFNTFTLSVSTFGNAVAASARKIGLITAAITGAIGAVVLFAKSTAANSERIDNQAKSLGVSVEAYQNFETAAKNAGLEQAAFDKILQKFVVNAAEAGDEAGEASKKTTDLAKSLRQVEVTAEDGSKKMVTVRGTSEDFAKSLIKVGTAGKGSEKDLLAFAKRVTALGTSQERLNAVLAAGFDKRSAAATVTFLRSIANDADDASRALSKTIGPLSQLEIAVGVDLDNAFDRLGTNLTRTKDRLALLFGPAITEAVNRFADLIFDNKAVIEEWAAFVRDKAVAIIKDFFNALAGNDEVVQNKSILAFRDGVIEFGQAVKSVIFGVVIPAFNGMIDILDGVAATINAVFGTEFTGKGILIAAVIGQMVGAFTILISTIGFAAAAIQLFTSGVSFIGAALGLVGPALVAFGQAVGVVIAGLAAVLGLPVTVTAAIVAAIAAAAAAIFIYWDEIVAAAGVAWEAIKAGAADVGNFIGALFSDGGFFKNIIDHEIENFNLLWSLIKDGASAAFGFLKSTALSAINAIISVIGSLISKVRDAISAIRSLVSARESAGESGGGGGFAQGGPVRGPGSGTSDSIPAWLSDGEFVIRAAAVRKWGVGIFQMLNGLRMPKGGFRFNMGGLVQAMAPRYASGGPVAAAAGGTGQGRPVTVNFGGESFQMSASDSVVHKLMKAATGKQIRSNGRKPAWFGA